MLFRRPPTPHAYAHAEHLPPSKFERLPAATDNYPRLRFNDIFATIGVIGLRLTDRARELRDRPVVIRGFMASPLLDRGSHFMLTRAPVHSCPFCDDGARWPDDAMPIFLQCDSPFIDPAHPIEVAGELDILNRANEAGEELRLVRLRNARWHPVDTGTVHAVSPSD